VLFAWSVTLCAQAPERPRSVLMLFSNRSSAPLVVETEAAFRRTVEVGLASPVDFHVEYLDFPETTGVPWTPELTDLLREKYVDRPLDLVAVQRSAALNFLLQNRAALFPGVPVVCFDIGHAEFERLQPPADVTAAFYVSDGQRTVDVALDLVPTARLVVIVAGGTTADRGAAAYVQRLVEARNPQLETLSLVGLPLEDQLKRLAELPHDSVVVFASYRADVMGRSMVAADVLRLVARVSNAPTFGAAEPWLGRGIVGGDLIRYGPQAQRAGELAVRLLRGEPVAAVRPVDVKSSALMFDWRELRRWGIDEKRVPAGSTVLYREPDFWADHKWEVAGVAGALVGQGLLIAALLFERRSRHRAQAGLVEAERRYRTVADFTTDWEYWTRPDGSFAYVSPSCLAITGYDAAAFMSRPSLLTEIILDEDRALWTAHRHPDTDSLSPARLEFRIRTAAGEVRWIDHVCAPVVGEDGANLGIRGSNRDVTERKRSEEELRGALEEIRQLRDRLEVDNTYMREQLQLGSGLEGFVAASDVMRYVASKVQQVAPTSSTVLLQGETGVGKSLVAQAIHNASPRRKRPLVTLNCAALPPALIESELFGHEKGAFTGAHAQRRGRFEIADQSTLFLDEIGELPLDLQGKLLRTVQDGEFERVGGNVTLKTHVRLIAATNRKLDDEVHAGRFRADLWYRLNVFPITVPPLRQRPEDIPLLVSQFVDKHCRNQAKPVLSVSKATMKVLQARDWPGNVRELENAIERAVISSRGAMLDLGDALHEPGPPLAAAPAGGAGGRQTLVQLEHDHIVATLERLKWKVEGDGGAAEVLGINPSTLRTRMRKHGIKRPQA
jgi:PAS domain S-box-containing protein